MKISFTDFWWKFDPQNNFFLDACRANIDSVKVVDPEKADVLFFSCFGDNHKKYNCKKVYYSGESTDPPWQDCDYALTFNLDEKKQSHFRLPLWMLYIDWFKKDSQYVNPQFMFPVDGLLKNKYSIVDPKYFCVAVYNRDPIGNRTEFINKLSQKMPQQVYAFGESFGKIPYGEDKKCEVICNFKFNMCFENRSKPGYHTEKLFHAKLCGTIPVYWSADTYKLDFNQHCCLHLDNYESIDHLVDEVISLHHDKKKYAEIAKEPLFNKSPSLDSFYKFLSEGIIC